MGRILIVEDDPAVRLLLKTILEQDGHTVSEARDGQEGVDKYRNEGADMVISDILMPVKDGLEVIQELRQDNPHVRLIAMTAYDEEGEVGYLQLAEEYGADRAFSKPILAGDRRHAVSELLGH
jgi:CheY-like chemotaxis protein